MSSMKNLGTGRAVGAIPQVSSAPRRSTSRLSSAAFLARRRRGPAASRAAADEDGQVVTSTAEDIAGDACTNDNAPASSFSSRPPPPTHRPVATSSWTAKDARDGRGSGPDYLENLGRGPNYNINVTHGQSLDHLDAAIAGDGADGRFHLGAVSDIADGSLRHDEFRTFGHLVGDYEVAGRYASAVATHLTKNYLADVLDLAAVGTPLLLASPPSVPLLSIVLLLPTRRCRYRYPAAAAPAAAGDGADAGADAGERRCRCSC